MRISDYGLLIATGRSRRALPVRTRGAAARNHSAFRTPQSLPRPAMTLIELMVVVVIATTLVVGVVPLLSPNNDARKIREASRELSTYVMRAQAEAARTGRPYGIAFRETAPDSGFALEAFMVAEPAPFAGFDDYSKVRFINAGGQVGAVEFVYFNRNTGNYDKDPPPPNFLKWGDIVVVDGARYRIVDRDQDGDNMGDDENSPPFRPGLFYTNSEDVTRNIYRCSYVGNSPPLMAFNGSGRSTEKSYVIRRQAASTSAEPLTFPRGVGIDLVGSGFDAVRFDVATTPVITPPNALPVTNPAPAQFARLLSKTWTEFQGNNPPPTQFDFGTPLAVQVMFSPSGEVDSVVVNGERQKGFTKLFLLLGRFENAQENVRTNAAGDYTIVPAVVDLNGLSEEEFEERQEEVNWLNLDSRWLVVAASTGRAVVGDNRVIDPAFAAYDYDLDDNDLEVDLDDQLTHARGLAAEMKRTGK